MMRIRDRILRKLKKSNNQSLIDLYKQFRNRVSVSLNESKASYYYNYFQQNSNNMKQLWSGIKSVVSIKKSSNLNVINKLKDSNGNITSDPAVIANIFNKFFVNVSFFFFYSNINIYNISYVELYLSNYFTTLQVRYHGERKTMTTPWPI